MPQESLDAIIGGIITALESTQSSLDSAAEKYSEEVPSLVQELMTKINLDKVEGVSLLSLKNSSLLAYLNNLVLIVLTHLKRLETKDISQVEELKLKAVHSSIVHRVCLEKGIKPLEKKLNYQLDKMVRSYNRTIEDEAKAEAKVAEKQEKADSEESDSDSDSESEDDALSYRPDAAALAKMSKSSKPLRESKGDGVYKPPKISAVAPPTAVNEKEDKGSNRKLQSMEEYLQEASDLPQVETSIGSTIVGHGRGGIKTSKDRQKEAEVQRYEENNFTRLPSTTTKKTFKEKQRDKINNFAGEDWSMFNNNRNFKEGTSRKRKATTAWDKVKRKRD